MIRKSLGRFAERTLFGFILLYRADGKNHYARSKEFNLFTNPPNSVRIVIRMISRAFGLDDVSKRHHVGVRPVNENGRFESIENRLLTHRRTDAIRVVFRFS